MKALKALSFKEPYASLMLHGKIETRTWKTNYRGQVLICATRKAFTTTDLSKIAGAEQLYRIRRLVKEEDYLRSKAIAVATLTDCRPMTKSDEELCFVKYKEGLFCHIYTDVKPIEPFFWSGVQGWSNVPEAVANSIKYLPKMEWKPFEAESCPDCGDELEVHTECLSQKDTEAYTYFADGDEVRCSGCKFSSQITVVCDEAFVQDV